MRRLSQYRSSAAIAIAIVTATVLGLIGVGEFPGWRDRDRLVRHSRGSSQRLRSTDAIAHEDESPDSVVAPVLNTQLTSEASLADVVSVHAPPGPAIIPTQGPDFGPNTDFIVLSYFEPSSLVLARHSLPTLGRAPPLS